MAFLRCDYRSKSLEMATSFCVVLPDDRPLKDTPVVYLLHGLSDNCTNWERYTSVERYAMEHNIAVVMPEVQRSFYTDMELGLKYFEFVSKELRDIVHHLFNLPTSGSMNYVMGLSMGGYGALKCALTYPNKFAGCGAFSPAVDVKELSANGPKVKKNEFKAIYGDEIKNNNDIFYLIKKSKKAPFIYLACGESDFIFSHTQKLDNALREKGLEYTYEHWDGIHDWAFWDEAVRRAFNIFF